jgi:hypothetical protein
MADHISSQDIPELELPQTNNSIASNIPHPHELLIGGVCFILLVLCITYISIYKNTQQTQMGTTKTPIAAINEASTTNLQDSILKPSVNPSPVKTSRINLIRTTEKDDETIFSLETNATHHVITSGPYIIWDTSNASGSAQIFVHNTTTDESKILFDETDYFNDQAVRSVNQMKVINDNLYFSLGGYLVRGAMYYTDTSFNDPVKRLTNIDNGRIERLYNHYFIIGGEGDGCGGYSMYKLFDEKTKTVTDIAKMEYGCGGGDYFIGIDKDDRFIIGNDQSESDSYPQDDIPAKNVFAIPLKSPGVKDTVIAEEKMPMDITRIFLKEDSNELVLQGKKNYLFNIDTGELTEDQHTLPTPTPNFSYENESIETTIQNLKLPKNYRFEMK